MELNTQTSRWIRGKLIGKGSYGTVGLGFHDGEHGPEPFAVKTAEKSSFCSSQALENEIEILRSVSSSSPFIVDYYGHDETITTRNLFLEYLPGGDVAKGGKVSDVELIRSYTWCLVAALREVHRSNIVHCDVKGSNVLVGSTKGVAKLADFGSAKLVSETVPRGSPLWMAPEVIRGESQGFESDVWSIGCTVIEMFTGKPAWEDNGAHTLFKIGYSGDLPEYPPQLPEMGRDFLDKCLVREVRERWSCERLLDHPFLVNTLAGKMLEASPRSILDWDYIDFSGECDGDQVDYESDKFSARGRIGKLATILGVNWESDDDWIDVRNVNVEIDEEEASILASDMVWTSREYPDLCEGEDEIISEFDNDDDCTWINLSKDTNDVEIDFGVDGEHGDHHGGSLCRQVETIVTRTFLLTLILLFKLYLSTSIGLVPNVNMLSLNKTKTNNLFLNNLLMDHANFGEV